MKKEDEKYETFWKQLVEDADGNINMDKLKAELYDFSTLIANTSKVYCHVTGGSASHPLTDPDVIIALADDECNKLIALEIKETESALKK